MRNVTHIDLPVAHMRGDTGDGIFLCKADLPAGARGPGTARDRLLASLAAHRGATHVTIVAATAQPCHDIECVSGHVVPGRQSIGWMRDCAGMAAAAAVFAFRRGFIHRERIPQAGTFALRIWQPRVRKTIIVHVPVDLARAGWDAAGMVALRMELVDPAPPAPPGRHAVLPTGNATDVVAIPGGGTVTATVVDVGLAVMLVDAAGLPPGVALAGPIGGAHPVVVAAPGGGTQAGHADAEMDADVVVRGAVPDAAVLAALGVAAAIPNTVVWRIAGASPHAALRVGGMTGVVPVAAAVKRIGDEWIVPRAVLQGRAGMLADDVVRLPA